MLAARQDAVASGVLASPQQHPTRAAAASTNVFNVCMNQHLCHISFLHLTPFCAQVRLWKVPFAPLEPGPVECSEEAVLQFQGRNAFRAIDHHWRENLFATAGAAVEVWSHERSEPVNTFSWGADAVLSVRFNPVSRVCTGCCV